MGLTMREKKALTKEVAVRYRAESKKGKQAMQLLNSCGKETIRIIDGQAFEVVVG